MRMFTNRILPTRHVGGSPGLLRTGAASFKRTFGSPEHILVVLQESLAAQGSRLVLRARQTIDAVPVKHAEPLVYVLRGRESLRACVASTGNRHLATHAGHDDCPREGHVKQGGAGVRN